MILRDFMVYAGIRTSRRFSRLSWFQRDLFMGVLHACDDYGRFEADAEKLWSVLYALDRAKVAKRDVQEGLLRFAAADIGLVKFYTVRGVGYGKVHNYRQNGLRKRRALYPDEEGGPPEPELFEAANAFFSAAPERKKEGNPPIAPREAGGGDASQKVTKPMRFRRAQRMETLHEERQRLENEMRDILRPGGCAYNVTPTGEKAQKFSELKAAHDELLKRIAKRREELSKEDAA